MKIHIKQVYEVAVPMSYKIGVVDKAIKRIRLETGDRVELVKHDDGWFIRRTIG